MKKGFSGIDKCLDDGGTCGLGGFCNECPLLKFEEKQKPLPPEQEKVLTDNLENLYDE